MNMEHKKYFIFTLITIFQLFLLGGCNQDQNVENLSISTPKTESTKEALLSEIPTNVVEPLDVEKPNYIWVDPKLKIKASIGDQNWLETELVQEKKDANFWVVDSYEKVLKNILFEQFFVLSVPLISTNKNMEFSALQSIWLGENDTEKNYWIWIQPKDMDSLKVVMGGEAGQNVISSEKNPLECMSGDCLKISDFLDIEPRWKVISVDQQSPLMNGFDEEKYPLVYRIGVVENPSKLPADQNPLEISIITNFDPDKLTSILLTGTTALVRNTAYQIEQFGYGFPYENINEIINNVDLIHISNEVPFYSACPPAVSVRPEMRFCSDPDYLNIFLDMGVDVVELTGNHLSDWGPEALLETLEIYDANRVDYYGGGLNLERASEPLLLEHNGNRIAFLGCNVTGPENNWATSERPGTLKCDLDEMDSTVQILTSQGYNTIFTFQHFEFNTFQAVQQMRDDFWRIAKAGARVVSGSQAHYPHGFDFVDSSFIHYGLGNFFFDQMYTYWGMATIDVHYFYNNTYINSSPLAIINENFGQPRLMTDEEAVKFFEKLKPFSFYYDKTE